MKSDNKTKTYKKLLTQINSQLQEVKAARNHLIHSAFSTDIVRTRQSTHEQIKLRGMDRYYTMRDEWNFILKWALVIILAFNILLVLLVGFGVLKYQDEWFLRIVLTTNLANILGLIYLVVKFLFSDRPFDNEDNK